MGNALLIEYIALGSCVRSSAKGNISQLETLSPPAVPICLVPQMMSGEKNAKALITQMHIVIEHQHPTPPPQSSHKGSFLCKTSLVSVVGAVSLHRTVA